MGKKDVKEKPSGKPKGSSKSEKNVGTKKGKAATLPRYSIHEPDPVVTSGEPEANNTYRKESELKEILPPYKFVDPEWNSEYVRHAKLIRDGFTCCLVIVMEDSAALTKYGEYLLRAVESGVRKKFMCISGAHTAERVKRFLINTGQRDWQAVDDTYMDRQDVFAEAVKVTMLGIKETVATEIDADIISKEMELAGARSKDFVRYVPPLILPTNGSGDGDGGGIREPPPVPPPTEMDAQRKTKREGSEDQSAKSGARNNIGVKTRMRKRGEVSVPEFEVIDDTPPNGPRSYVLLQGFYNPRLIEELRKIGVIVDGILLMTDDNVVRYNFSIMDVEDSIPGTFRPRNVLPKYLKAMEKLTLDPETRNTNVTQFWSMLSEIYNSSPSDSPFHDIALMNFCLPDTQKALQLDTPEGLTLYMSKVFDEVAKRVYEMLVLEEWFKEFAAQADITQLQPLEPDLPHDIYEQIVGKIPAECISIPIILEAVVQQVAYTLDREAGKFVPDPCYEEDITSGLIMGASRFGSTDWGTVPKKHSAASSHKGKTTGGGDAYEHGKRAETDVPGSPVKSVKTNSIRTSSQPLVQPLLKTPFYIKAGDYASIRSCHLNETLAAKIASCQLSGDMRNINGFLWNDVPQFNKGLYVKLLANLNHFMYFLPPGLIEYEDMFYVLHLLMSAGVEVHLQKQAIEAKKKALESNKPLLDASKPSDMVLTDDVYFKNRPDSDKFPGTNLNMGHNFLAVSKKSGLHFVITPTSNHELTIASFGHTAVLPHQELEANAAGITTKDVQAFLKETQHTFVEEPPLNVQKKKPPRKKKSKHHRKVDQNQKSALALDSNKVARITTTNAIESAVEFAHISSESKDKSEKETLTSRKSSKINKNLDKGTRVKNKRYSNESGRDQNNDGHSDEPDHDHSQTESLPRSEVQETLPPPPSPVTPTPKRRSQWDKAPTLEDYEVVVVSGEKDKDQDELAHQASGFSTMNNINTRKKFIACEEQWFEDIHDTSVIQALLECPALLAINESGALDISKWIEKYLLSCGLDMIGGEGVLLGDLKNWNYIEELVPIQTVQMLNEATQDYLSMQRMYCPFYDTLLFIFNNPTPKDLTAETQFYFKLKTLPGLQHFLEYTMNDQDVLKWIEQLDSSKRLEMGETCSINTLLNIIPEDQWLLIPSIKYQILVENTSNGSTQRKSGSNYPAKGSGRQSLVKSVGVHNMSNSPTTSAEGEGSPTQLRTSMAPAALKEFEEIDEAAAEMEADADNADSSKARRLQPGATNHKPASTGEVEHIRNSKDGQDNGKLLEKQSPPLSLEGESEEKKVSVDNEGASHPAETVSYSKDRTAELSLARAGLNFTCYDLGKRVAVVGNDTFYAFPMDGSIIRYDISTIEPEFRMMQLSVMKNGHQTFFYPYYIPHDFDLSAEDYVVCPYFHMVLSNGTIFAFQDLRAEEAAPYMKVALKDNNRPHQELFSYEKVLFGREVEQKLTETGNFLPAKEISTALLELPQVGLEQQKMSNAEYKMDDAGSSKKSDKSGIGVDNKRTTMDPNLDAGDDPKKNKKALKDKKSRKLLDKSPEPDATKSKRFDKKNKRNKLQKSRTDDENEDLQKPPSPTEDEYEGFLFRKEGLQGETDVGIGNTPPTTTEVDSVPGPAPASEDDVGDWLYPSSENSEDEAEAQQKRRQFFAPPWDDAVKILDPLAHVFKVTLPSGLIATIEDVPGPPLLRVIKQTYLGEGSARLPNESSRYYTMDGSVIKFLLNGSIQILTARGVTTNIMELAANSRRNMDNPTTAFHTASIVKIFNGNVILPNGQYWHIVNGKKVPQNPVYVFTTGPLAGGEVFRRRQDGVIYLHRYDGTVITHYPDGTRFTTRMVVLEEYEEEFSDWVFVGMKYMIEHPKYCTVLFNSLSGNLHLKLPHGEWVRVFADGNVRITTEDDYKFDVDKNRAVLSYPPCGVGSVVLPNVVAVRLWHTARTDGLPQAAKDTTVNSNRQRGTEPSNKAKIEVIPLETNPLTEITASSAVVVGGGELVGKKSKNAVDKDRLKSLHPKIKQRDSKKVRATRMSGTNVQIIDSKDKTLPTSPVTPEVQTRQVSPASDAPNPAMGVININDAGNLQDTQKKDTDKIDEKKAEKTKSSSESTELEEFLKFSDETTFCKSFDSWNNRFIMNIYGGIQVEKQAQEETKQQTTQQMINTLSEHCNLPKDYFTGILRNTSSEHLASAARRLQSFKQTYADSCTSGLPKVKIFVVKRDMTGFQYLQKTQVDEVVTKAYSSRESIVLHDPLPKRTPRKFITVMRPVEEMEYKNPHGMWTRPYIEPIFRPRNVTNKHLQIANPNDLRWFGYVLSSAHQKRPKYVFSPKENYLKVKTKNQAATVPTTEKRAKILGSQGSAQAAPDAHGRRRSNEEDGEEGEEELLADKSDKESQHSGATMKIKPVPSAVDDDKKKKKKDKKEKKPAKKKPKRKESVQLTTEDEEEDVEEAVSVGVAAKGSPIVAAAAARAKSKKTFRLNEAEPEIAEYPQDIDDIQGIYSMDDEKQVSHPARITLQQHSSAKCSTKKAVVVRAFVEIPAVDENLQRALLAASMSYAETVKTETAIFNTYKPEDPRTGEEKRAQNEYKQQLIEQNIEDMHLLEQKPGPTLRFHF